MPAHVKTALLDTSVTVPIRDGSLALGRYQGIFLCEHLTVGRPRHLLATLWGERLAAQ